MYMFFEMLIIFSTIFSLSNANICWYKKYYITNEHWCQHRIYFLVVFFMAVFSERLKELRKAKGLSQRALAEAVGMSDTGIQNYELKVRTPNADIIIKLADYFEVSTDYLLGCSDKTER